MMVALKMTNDVNVMTKVVVTTVLDIVCFVVRRCQKLLLRSMIDRFFDDNQFIALYKFVVEGFNESNSKRKMSTTTKQIGQKNEIFKK